MSEMGIFLVNVQTGDKKRITEGGHGLREVVVSGRLHRVVGPEQAGRDSRLHSGKQLR